MLHKEEKLRQESREIILRSEESLRQENRGVILRLEESLHREIREDIARLEKSLSQEMIRQNLRNRLIATHALWKTIDDSKYSHRVEPRPESFDVYLQRMKALHPNIFSLWENINFEMNPKEFAERPTGSCSLESHVTAEYFSGFIAPYLHGRVLDIGCGPYALPVYLYNYPTELISGIDPITPFEPHLFQFVRGFAEFLPWPDGSFDTVVAATTLDHVLSLELAISEIRRVLVPDGKLLVWDGFIKGSVPYNPSEGIPTPPDKFHLFHFDEEWFEEFMKRWFVIHEKINFDGLSYFYCLRVPRKSSLKR
jgi:SAM-dependent methyltransferase